MKQTLGAIAFFIGLIAMFGLASYIENGGSTSSILIGIPILGWMWLSMRLGGLEYYEEEEEFEDDGLSR